MSINPLAGFARRATPEHHWDDVTQATDAMTALRRIPAEFTRERATPETGDHGRRPSGRGVAALFIGPSGSGKTLAAEAIASELSRDVIRIDSRAVVSKYVSETEKNLDAIFAEAANGEAVLLFDEADALFGRRTETRDSHDRYQNLGIDYLMRRIEEYSGIVILATNRRDNIDEALVRRMRFIIIEFSQGDG